MVDAWWMIMRVNMFFDSNLIKEEDSKEMAKVCAALNIKQFYHLETTTNEVYAQNLLGA